MHARIRRYYPGRSVALETQPHVLPEERDLVYSLADRLSAPSITGSSVRHRCAVEHTTSGGSGGDTDIPESASTGDSTPVEAEPVQVQARESIARRIALCVEGCVEVTSEDAQSTEFYEELRLSPWIVAVSLRDVGVDVTRLIEELFLVSSASSSLSPPTPLEVRVGNSLELAFEFLSSLKQCHSSLPEHGGGVTDTAGSGSEVGWHRCKRLVLSGCALTVERFAELMEVVDAVGIPVMNGGGGGVSVPAEPSSTTAIATSNEDLPPPGQVQTGQETPVGSRSLPLLVPVLVVYGCSYEGTGRRQREFRVATLVHAARTFPRVQVFEYGLGELPVLLPQPPHLADPLESQESIDAGYLGFGCGYRQVVPCLFSAAVEGSSVVRGLFEVEESAWGLDTDGRPTDGQGVHGKRKRARAVQEGQEPVVGSMTRNEGHTGKAPAGTTAGSGTDPASCVSGPAGERCVPFTLARPVSLLAVQCVVLFLENFAASGTGDGATTKSGAEGVQQDTIRPEGQEPMAFPSRSSLAYLFLLRSVVVKERVDRWVLLGEILEVARYLDIGVLKEVVFFELARLVAVANVSDH